MKRCEEGGMMIMESIERAKKVLKDWKGDSYAFGEDVLEVTGKYAKKYGKKVTLIVTELVRPGFKSLLNR